MIADNVTCTLRLWRAAHSVNDVGNVRRGRLMVLAISSTEIACELDTCSCFVSL